MQRRTFTLAAGVAAVASTMIVSAADATAGTRPRVELQGRLDAVVAGGAVSAIAEVRSGAGIWRGGAGTAELGRRSPAPVNGRYRAGSVTKALVAVVVLQLADEGRLGLSDSVDRWLPGLVPNGGVITIRDLLHHTSGLPDYADELLPTPSSVLAIRLRTFQPVELVRLADKQPPLFPPGTAQHYSNTDYVLLGMIIDAATGHSWRTEVARRILWPVGMHDSELPGGFPLVLGPHAHVYVADADGAPVDVTTMNPSMADAAGELISTTADLNKFFRALVAGRLLPPATLADMTDDHGTGFGLGLEVADLPCGRVLGHGGGGPGFLGLSFITADGTRQITLTTTLWRGDPRPAATAMMTAALCQDSASFLTSTSNSRS